MTGAWHPTTALVRALVVSGLATAGALVLGRPLLMVLAAPLVLLGSIGLAHRPARRPVVRTRLEHQRLHEGQATRSLLDLEHADDAEFLARTLAPTEYVEAQPGGGSVGTMLGHGGAPPEIVLGPRRWGVHALGPQQVGAQSRWSGYQWGPVSAASGELTVWPAAAPFDSRAEAPHPVGLVGQHRGRRTGSGSELAGIRPFQPGDRLRRINWRVSLRTGDLHVVSTHAEQDTAVLVIVDALTEVGVSGGIDGAASSLDTAVRAAAAVAEHHIRRGDRVSLRVAGRQPRTVPFAGGLHHFRRIQGVLAEVQPGSPPRADGSTIRLSVTEGTVVVILSPLLSPAIGTVAHQLTSRGLPVLVIDTLAPEATPATGQPVQQAVADLAWRMRRGERDLLVEALTRTGCPVVGWRGPGTIDDVMRKLARRSRLPQVRSR